MTWSVIADIDVNSEFMRCCGDARFTLYGVWRVLALRDYHGQFSTNDGDLVTTKNQNLFNEHQIDVNTNFKYFCVYNVPFAGLGHYFAPKASLDDGYLDTLIVKEDKSRL